MEIGPFEVHDPGVETTVAQQIPTLFRAVLDGLAELDARGHRVEARWIRRQAMTAYARAWDDRTRRTLERLIDRIGRVLSGHARPRISILPPLRRPDLRRLRRAIAPGA